MSEVKKKTERTGQHQTAENQKDKAGSQKGAIQ